MKLPLWQRPNSFYSHIYHSCIEATFYELSLPRGFVFQDAEAARAKAVPLRQMRQQVRGAQGNPSPQMPALRQPRRWGRSFDPPLTASRLRLIPGRAFGLPWNFFGLASIKPTEKQCAPDNAYLFIIVRADVE